MRHHNLDYLIHFYMLLENHNKLNDENDLLGFFDDFNRLEKQYYELHIELGYVPLYRSLRNRIQKFADTKLGNKRGNELDMYNCTSNHFVTCTLQYQIKLTG